MPTMQAQPVRGGVLVLEDEASVRDAWVHALGKALPQPDFYVCGAASEEEADGVIRRAEEQGYPIVLVLVDQVLGKDREAGPRFLRRFRETHPHAQRLMFSGQSQRDELQKFLDDGLIHHFQSKSAFASDSELPETFLSKVKGLVSGRSRGNISDPDFESRFKEELKKWISALPEGENTKVRWLSGRTMKAGDILGDRKLLTTLQQGYLTSTLHGLFADAVEEKEE